MIAFVTLALVNYAGAQTACDALILADNLHRVVTNDARSFDLVERQVAPLLRNVSTFVHQHATSPAVAEWTELADQSARLHDDIVARLETIKKLRKPPGAWTKWWPRGRTDLDVAVTDVRLLHHALLHHALLRLTAELTERTPAIDGIAAGTRELLAEADRTLAALDVVHDRLTESGVDGETRRRLGVLTEDLRLQTQLVRNLDELFTQRTQLNRFAAERARRLLEVILPMEALLGGARLDVSPLAPQHAAAQPARAVRLPVAADPAAPAIPVATAIALAARSGDWQGRANIISRYVQTHRRALSPADVIEAARSLPRDYRIDEPALQDYVRARATELAVGDVIALAKLLPSYGANRLIVLFAEIERSTLIRDDFAALATAASDQHAIALIMDYMAAVR